MTTFNNCSVVHYLKWAYDVTHEFCENLNLNDYMNTRVILCQVHILKNIAKQASDILKNKKCEKYLNYNKVKQIFLCGFTLLQNSTTMTEFDENLQNLYYILNNKYNSQKVSNATNNLKQKLNERNLGIFENYIQPGKFVDKKKTFNIFINDDDYDSIKTQSPFTKYYDDMIHILKNSIETMEDNQNHLYMPELFELIEKKLYLMPFWSAILIKQGQKILLGNNLVELGSKILNVTRMDNNFVENHFGHYKDDIFLKQKNLVISEIAGPIYRRLKSKYIEFYSDHNNEYNSVKKKKVSIANILENWGDKRKSSKRTKSYYYKTFLSPCHESEKMEEEQKISCKNLNKISSDEMELCDNHLDVEQPKNMSETSICDSSDEMELCDNHLDVEQAKNMSETSICDSSDEMELCDNQLSIHQSTNRSKILIF